MAKSKKPQKQKAKSYYPLSEVKEKIKTGKIFIEYNASCCAYSDFGWEKKEIKDALLKLSPLHFHKMDYSKTKPGFVLDFYKACINGENIYTHFYIDNDILVINSFKRI